MLLLSAMKNNTFTIQPHRPRTHSSTDKPKPRHRTSHAPMLRSQSVSVHNKDQVRSVCITLTAVILYGHDRRPGTFSNNTNIARVRFCIWAGGCNCPTTLNAASPQMWHETLFDELKASWYIGAKRNDLWPSKYAKMRFWPCLHPWPHWGAHDAPLDPLVGWGGDILPSHPTWRLHFPFEVLLRAFCAWISGPLPHPKHYSNPPRVWSVSVPGGYTSACCWAGYVP